MRVWYGEKRGDTYYCIMPDCQCFASSAQLFRLHMKRKHDVEVETKDVLKVCRLRLVKGRV